MGMSEAWWKAKGGDLIQVPSVYEAAWGDLAEYHNVNIEPNRTITVQFANDAEVREFAEMMNAKITDKTKSVWFEPPPRESPIRFRWVTVGGPVMPRYPIYIISKGRWGSNMTHRALARIGVPHKVVIEPTEYEQYSAVINPALLLVLPFHDLGQGGIPARNWVWEHSIGAGYKRHWILDDNICRFYRFHQNTLLPVSDGVGFAACEDLADKYSNIRMAGLQYFMFVQRRLDSAPPFSLNTRVYSCILLDNSTKHRWRGRYNEDTDLSLRFLKDGDCTALVNAFPCDKRATMTIKGGNLATVYGEENARTKMAKSLQEQHPDVVQVGTRWGRDQHVVNYEPFAKNALVLSGLASAPKSYQMSLEKVDDNGVWVPADIAEAQ